MIRLVYVLRRKENLSQAEFQTYWKEKHGPPFNMRRAQDPLDHLFKFPNTEKASLPIDIIF